MNHKSAKSAEGSISQSSHERYWTFCLPPKLIALPWFTFSLADWGQTVQQRIIIKTSQDQTYTSIRISCLRSNLPLLLADDGFWKTLNVWLWETIKSDECQITKIFTTSLLGVKEKWGSLVYFQIMTSTGCLSEAYVSRPAFIIEVEIIKCIWWKYKTETISKRDEYSLCVLWHFLMSLWCLTSGANFLGT